MALEIRPRDGSAVPIRSADALDPVHAGRLHVRQLMAAGPPYADGDARDERAAAAGIAYSGPFQVADDG